VKIGILGTGDVGRQLATKLVAVGNEVKMGSRTARNPKAVEWAKANGPKASAGTFADAAKFGEVVFNCTPGAIAVEALKMAGADNLKGKVLVDVSNPLDFSKGMPPTLTVCNTDSVGEQVQRAFPAARVVKAFNTVSNTVMVDPKLVPGQHDIFLCGNDAKAKSTVVEIMKSFGWKSPVDLGDISGARGMEMVLPLWVRLMMTYQNPNFNFKIVR
jgi:8-hydroxy-5-deazaflavin:NADPH oxidoreductase